MTTVIAFILLIGALVVVHEFGHFIVAKASGIWVKEFAFGFGKRLWSFRRGDTTYAVNLLPLGGYVMMAGMEPNPEPDPRNFDRKPLVNRFLTILAGPVMNLLMAAVLFAAILVFWGQANANQPVVGQVLPGYPAASAGIRPGDRVLSVAGERITSWTQIAADEKGKTGEPLKVVVSRHGHRLSFTIRPKYDPQTQSGIIGISPAVVYAPVPFTAALGQGASQTWAALVGTVTGIVSPLTHGKAPPLVGVVGIANLAGQTLRSGWTTYMGFAAILSVNLALFNLLPIPPLDGSRFVLIALEGVRQRPISQRVEALVLTVGFYLLIAFAVFLAYHDLVTGL